MQRLLRGWSTWLLLSLSVVHMGCEYVRPTLNASLEVNNTDRFSSEAYFGGTPNAPVCQALLETHGVGPAQHKGRSSSCKYSEP